MTKKEYKRLKAATRDKARITGNKMAKQIRTMYSGVLRDITPMVKRLPAAPLSDANEKKIKDAMNSSEIENKIRAIMAAGLESAISETVNIDREYVKDVAGKIFGEGQIDALFDRVIERFTGNAFKNVTPMRKVYNRAVYSLSSSIWGSSETFKDKVLAFVGGSLEAGIDPVRIAKDLQNYLVEGSEFAIGRWGTLVPGTSDYRKRIGTAGADYRTIRLARNEMYVAIRESDIAVGSVNPACLNQFNWVLTPSRADWDCDCPSNAAGSPYTQAQIQNLTDSIHVSCMCRVEPAVMDDEAFMKDLEDYIEEADTPGAQHIEQWAERYGLTAA
jgi:hypothetical protein